MCQADSSSVVQVAERLDVPVKEVKNVIIWGNHSSTQYPDVNHGTVNGTPIRKAVDDDAYLNGDFVKTVQQRGAAIIKVFTWCLMPYKNTHCVRLPVWPVPAHGCLLMLSKAAA